jgi:hypothetical protein
MAEGRHVGSANIDVPLDNAVVCSAADDRKKVATINRYVVMKPGGNSKQNRYVLRPRRSPTERP